MLVSLARQRQPMPETCSTMSATLLAVLAATKPTGDTADHRGALLHRERSQAGINGSMRIPYWRDRSEQGSQPGVSARPPCCCRW